MATAKKPTAFRDLGAYLALLEKEGELQRITAAVDAKHEIGAICRKLNITGGPAVLFENVKGSKIPVVAQLLATNRRLALALGCAERDLFDVALARSADVVPPKRVKTAPCQEVVRRGRDVDLAMLPLCVNNPDDGERYITAGHVILKDRELGFNLAIYRMMFRSPNEVYLRFIPSHNGWAFLKKAEARGDKALPIAVAIGVDPSVYIASQFEPKIGSNEIEIAGALRGAPVEVVRCKTIDVEVPAHAEIVLECEMKLPPRRGTEGPFGEFCGYTTDKVEGETVVDIKAITHRKNPVYHNIWLGKPPHEHLFINAFSYGVQAYYDLKVRYPAVKACYAPPAGVSIKLVVQIHTHMNTPGMVKNLLAATLWTRGAMWKEVIVVDDDIDLTDDAAVAWAVVTRVQPTQDIFILPGGQGSRLDPSSDAFGVTDKMFIDATKKRGFRGKVAEPTAAMMAKVDARWKEYGFK